jgi:hypothetical protein
MVPGSRALPAPRNDEFHSFCPKPTRQSSLFDHEDRAGCELNESVGRAADEAVVEGRMPPEAGGSQIELARPVDRGREGVGPLPALRTVRAVFPHTALQSLVSTSGVSRRTSRLATDLPRIRFVILRTAGSPPAAPHHASRRRSYLRLLSQRPAPARTCTALPKRPLGRSHSRESGDPGAARAQGLPLDPRFRVTFAGGDG